jgi:hypothetical protein
MLTKIKFAPGIDKQDTAVGAEGKSNSWLQTRIDVSYTSPLYTNNTRRQSSADIRRAYRTFS